MDELRHYGVMGMKWGIRRARRNDAKQAYRKSENSAFKKYERDIAKLESSYKRGQKLSEADMAKELKIEKTYHDSVAKAKATYKQAKKDTSRDADIANRLYSRQDKKANKAIANMSTGKALTQSLLLGSYGALKYNEARGKGYSKGKAAIAGIFANTANNSTGGLLSAAKYLDNREARKKK